jgi:Multicopper oxidase
MRKPNSVWSTIFLTCLVRKAGPPCFLVALICVAALPAAAQSFRVQCPTSTITHPDPTTTSNVNGNPYNGPTQFTRPTTGTAQWVVPTAGTVNGGIKCQQVSGGDGFMTEADGTQTFMFSFGPLSGLAEIAAGHPGTQPPSGFNVPYPGSPNLFLQRGDPATSDGAMSGASPGSGGTAAAPFTWNGAVGLTPEIVQTVALSDLVAGPLPTPATAPHCPAPTASTVTGYLFEPLGIPVGAHVMINQAPTIPGTTNPIIGSTPIPTGFVGNFTVTCVDSNVISPEGSVQFAFQYTDGAAAGLGAQTALVGPTASTPPALDGHVDPRPIIDIGVMNGNIPAPLVQFDEDDELFLTLTNVGMIMRPDLFEQHTIHFHGYPNASSFYDGVPDASIAINIGASFTYYYLAPDAGTYFWHCHITPPEHLQMGMVGQLHVRPRQDRIPAGTGAFPNGGGASLYTYLGYQNGIGLASGTAADLRTACNPGADILCSATMPFGGVAANTATQGLDKLGNPQRYTYNDGDGSTAYDVEYPLQMHGFDPNFHFVGMTFNPEQFVDMKDKYFLLNGRSYPDTVGTNPTNSAHPMPPAGPQASMSADGQLHYSQPMPAVINIPVGGRALLRLVNLSVSEYHTLQSLGVPMKEVGFNAKLLRDQAGMNTEFFTNSITLGGGESLDVILDASDASCGSTGCATTLYPAGSVFYLYTPQLDHLSNDAENFGGLMTEVHICTTVTGGNTFGNACN